MHLRAKYQRNHPQSCICRACGDRRPLRASGAIALAEEITQQHGLKAVPHQPRVHLCCVTVEWDGERKDFYSRQSWYCYAESKGLQARPPSNVAIAVHEVPEESWF